MKNGMKQNYRTLKEIKEIKDSNLRQQELKKYRLFLKSLYENPI